MSYHPTYFDFATLKYYHDVASILFLVFGVYATILIASFLYIRLGRK